MVNASTSYFMRFYLSVEGRTGRKAYWLFYISPVVLIGVAFGFLISTVYIPARSAWVLLIAPAPLLVWVGIAVSVKRLHDIGRSGWWTVKSALSLTLIMSRSRSWASFLGIQAQILTEKILIRPNFQRFKNRCKECKNAIR